MKEHPDQEALRRQYLLGTLLGAERARLEESYLSDDDAFEEMETTEGELVNSYVRDELSPSERALLKERLLVSPRLLEKAKFAHALEKSLSVRRATQVVAVPDRPKSLGKRIRDWFFSVSPKSFGVALASCALLLLAFGAVLLVQWLRLRDQTHRLAADQVALEQQRQSLGQQSSSSRVRAEQLSAELAEQRAQNEKLQAELRAKEQRRGSNEIAGSSLIAFNLIPNNSRGGPGQDLKVSPGTKAIQLQLSLETADYQRYDVSIRNAARVEVFHRRDLHARRVGPVSSLVIRLLTKEFISGDYGVRVSGVTPAGSIETVENYVFRLSTKQK